MNRTDRRRAIIGHAIVWAWLLAFIAYEAWRHRS